ncbi:hypothetical protein SY28_01310 [Meiothermus taiwanensis]|nr:hypothetical protein SY28_01310 [Meiothermus taiwanensis]
MPLQTTLWCVFVRHTPTLPLLKRELTLVLLEEIMLAFDMRLSMEQVTYGFSTTTLLLAPVP